MVGHKMSNQAKDAAPPTLEIKSRQEAEAALAVIAETTAALNLAKSDLEREFARARTLIQPAITDAENKIKDYADALEAWAWRAQDEEFDASKKSLDLVHGTISFRTGPPKLKPLSRWTWDKILEQLTGPWMKYIRLYREPDKEAILRDGRGDKPALTPEQLAKMGLRIVQEESFTYELKKL